MDAMLIELMKFQTPTWVVVISVILGLLGCFLGYKLLRAWMAVIGFIIGMTIGYALSIEHMSNVAIPILIGFLLGVLLGFVAYRIYKLGVFVIAFSMTFTFIGQLLARYNEPGLVWIILTLIMATMAAILALKFVKPVIIISTSLNGAVTTMFGLFKLLAANDETTMILAAILLALLGIIVQFLTNKTKNDKDSK